jgi:hypothetical protein
MDPCKLPENDVEQLLKEIATEQKKFARRVKNYDDLRELFGGMLLTIFDLRMYLEKDPRQIIRNLNDEEKKDLLSEVSAWQEGIQLLQRSLCAPSCGTSLTPFSTLSPGYSPPRPQTENAASCLP